MLEQRTTHDTTHRDTDAGETGPDCDRPRPLLGREHVGQDRQRRRHHEGRTDAHHRVCADHRTRRARQRREQRRRTEHDQAAVEREPSSVAVTERTCGQQQAGEHQGVGVDDPLQATRPRVEVLGQGGQRHVEAGVGHHDHHEADAQHAERPPTALVLPLAGRLLTVQVLLEGGLDGGEVGVLDGVLFDGHRMISNVRWLSNDSRGVGFIRPFFYDELPGLDSTPCHRSTSVRNRMIYAACAPSSGTPTKASTTVLTIARPSSLRISRWYPF